MRGGVRVGGTGWRGVTGAGERRADLTRRGGGGLLGVPRVREPTLPGARREPRCVEWGRLVVALRCVLEEEEEGLGVEEFNIGGENLEIFCGVFSSSLPFSSSTLLAFSGFIPSPFFSCYFWYTSAQHGSPSKTQHL